MTFAYPARRHRTLCRRRLHDSLIQSARTWQYRSFSSFGNGFDSRRPLQILKNLLGFSSFPTSEARKASAVATVLLGGALENLLLVRSRANVPDKGTRGSLHSHNFREVDKSVTKSLDSWGTQYLISGTGLVGAFRLRRPHRCAVRILWVYHPRHSFSGTCRGSLDE
jgi:hypothetical protein